MSSDIFVKVVTNQRINHVLVHCIHLHSIQRAKVKFIWFFLISLHIRHATMLWHWHIIFGTRVYHHDTILVPNMSTFDLKVYDMAFVFGPQIFCHTILAHESINMVQWVTYIHDLCMTFTFGLNIKIIFSPWICLDKFRLCSLKWAYQIWHMGVSQDMLCTFMTFDLKVNISTFFSHGYFCGWVSLGQRTSVSIQICGGRGYPCWCTIS